MKLLLLGASGFVGKNLLARVAKERWEVVAVYNSSLDFPAYADSLGGDVVPRKCDLRKEKETQDLFSEFKDFDKTVYLASDTRVGYLFSDQPEDVYNNILPMANFVKHYDGGPVLFFSSGAVYSGQKGNVSHHDLHPTIPYAISKLAAELYLEHQASIDGFGHVTVRFFGAYGPYEPERKLTRKLLLALSSPADVIKFTVYGDGDNLIDVMYIDDAVQAVYKMLVSKKQDSVVDLCGGAAVSVNTFVNRIARILDKKLEIEHRGSVAEYIEFRASSEGFERAFGFSPRISLQEGIPNYMNWLRKSNLITSG